MTLAYEEAIGSLHGLDPAWPRPAVLDVLEAPENRHLLDYVQEDPFGAHVFPGNVPGYAPADFLRDLDAQLASSAPIHLWSYIPTCAYRCRFCQYPVVLVKGKPEVTYEKAKHWVDLNIREARMWLDAVPNLAGAEVGEFNVFGGTPSLLPEPEIRRLLDFYREEFGFTADTTIRFEGDPSTFTPHEARAAAGPGLHQAVQRRPVVRRPRPRAVRARALGADVRRLRPQRAAPRLRMGQHRPDVRPARPDPRQRPPGPGRRAGERDHRRRVHEAAPGLLQRHPHRRHGEKPAAWQLPSYRDKLVRDGHRWPTLGEQYQMRELLTDGLRAANYTEHPTMYFARDGLGPEKWKSIMVDQEKQEAEVAIGLGGSSSCRASEAITDVNSKRYIETVEAGRIPLGSATRFTPDGQEARAVKMALTTLQPLRDSVHASRFPGRSLFAEPWLGKFRSLADRGLVRLDSGAGKVELTRTGEVLVEAIITTEL